MREAKPRIAFGVGITAAVALGASVLAILLGAKPVSIATALADPRSLDRTILFELRPARVLLGAIAGGGLAMTGAAFQGLLQNPLAEPFVLGVSGGAAFGATCALVLGASALAWLGAAIVPACALAGGLAATALVYVVARREQRGSAGFAILLAGVMVNAIAAALVTFVKTLVPPSRTQMLLHWLTGSLQLPTLPALISVSAYVGLGCGVLLFDAARLNVLSLGDETAMTLGVDVRRVTRRVFFACSLVVGGIVSLTGLIGFVGLVVPHVLRRWIGPDHRALLPASWFGGAAMVVACDLAARLFSEVVDTELPVGAVTAIVGGPLFLWLLAKKPA